MMKLRTLAALVVLAVPSLAIAATKTPSAIKTQVNGNITDNRTGLNTWQSVKGNFLDIADSYGGLISSNTWTATQTFGVNPIFSGCTGYAYGNAASAVSCSTTIPTTALSGTFPATSLSGTINAAQFPAITGDCASIAGTTATSCTKTGGVAFAPSATTDTTNAANIVSGVLPLARLPAFGSGDASCVAGGGACTVTKIGGVAPGALAFSSSAPEAPNLWLNPCADFDQQFVGNEQIVYNNGLSTFAIDRVNTQQVTPTPHVSVVRSNDGAGGCSHSIKVTNGFSSGSTNTIGTGSKTFQMNGALNFVAGQINITAVDALDLNNTMTGSITSYSPSTGLLVLNVTTVTGSGTKSSWVVGAGGTTNLGITNDTATATSTAGSTTITVASTAGPEYFANRGISDHAGGSIIPVGSFIVNVVSGTQFNISKPLLSSLTNGMTFEVYGDNGVFIFENIATEEASGFRYATSSARAANICFYSRSFGRTGIATMNFYGYTSTTTLGRSLGIPFNVTTSWQRTCLKIPPDTVGNANTWAIPNAYGGLWGAIGFTIECQGGPTCAYIPANVWSNTFAAAGVPTQTLNITGSVGAWFEVTAIKLEISDDPTGFTPPDPRMELIRLESTYQKSYPKDSVPGQPTTVGFDEIYQVNGTGNIITQAGHFVPYHTRMRCAAPYVTFYSPVTGSIGKVRDYVSSTELTPFLLQNSSDTGFAYYAVQTSTTTPAIQIGAAWSAFCPF